MPSKPNCVRMGIGTTASSPRDHKKCSPNSKRSLRGETADLLGLRRQLRAVLAHIRHGRQGPNIPPSFSKSPGYGDSENPLIGVVSSAARAMPSLPALVVLLALRRPELPSGGA